MCVRASINRITITLTHNTAPVCVCVSVSKIMKVSTLMRADLVMTAIIIIIREKPQWSETDMN